MLGHWLLPVTPEPFEHAAFEAGLVGRQRVDVMSAGHLPEAHGCRADERAPSGVRGRDVIAGGPMADLKILARMTNLSGQAGRDAFPTFAQGNFRMIPEPSSLVLMSVAGAFLAGARLRRRRDQD